MRSGNVLLVAGSANFSTRDVWDGYRVALQEAGLNVIPYSTFSFLKLLSVDAVCNDIIGTALDEQNQIDFAIFVDGLYFRGHRARVPQSIRRAGVPTVLIATDDPYVKIPNTDSLYTVRFSNEKNSAWEGVEYLPTATKIPPEIPLFAKPTYDVSFLGTVFEDRAPLLVRVAEHCEQNQRRFLIAGKLLGDATVFDRFHFTDVRVKTIDEAEKWQIYADSSVTLNVFRQTELEACSPSPRVFEVTAFGHAALVSGPRRSEVDSIYGESVYHFNDPDSACNAIENALADPNLRRQKAESAKSISLSGQTYRHRAVKLVDHLSFHQYESTSLEAIETQTAWIIGCGRTGSTWLAEMLGDLDKIRRWHEPYFGRFFRHLQERPEDLDRNSSFFSRRQQSVWLQGIRELFFSVARDRFPQLGQHALVVKEVNTPELFPWIHATFPQSRMIMLARDPFDVFDSYLSLQLPGSWNQKFGVADKNPLEAEPAKRTAEHIHKTMTMAIEAYEAFPASQRLWISYEDLLCEPYSCLRQCAELIRVAVDEESINSAIEKHRFEKYKKQGPLEFRRQGTAGGWRTSSNFTGEIHQVANRILGDLRVRLGYQKQATEKLAQREET